MKSNKQQKQPKKIKEDIEEEHSELEECKAQNEDLKQQYLRALADYKNLKHRVDQERFRMRDAAKREVIEHMLPILDNLDQAEIFNNDPGLQLIKKSFRQSLENLGVEELELLGAEFDPSQAEVVEVVEGKQDNIIIEVIQKAFQLNGTVIRHGKVKVSRKSNN